MGKEWYWGGRSSKRGGGVAQTGTETPSGCMCAVFQIFDFHPFHFPMNHQQTSPSPASNCIPEERSVPTGAEAPRNSLESEDGTVSSVSKEEILKIPKNIQIKTSGSTRNLNDDLSSEISSTPGAKTPTLVARLMGLDLLPGANSPSSSSSSCVSTPNPQGNYPNLHHLRHTRQHIQTKHRNSIDTSDIAATARSLPETPRISLGRRSDVEYHHRLSLQINKENIIGLGHDEELLELPRLSFSKRKYDENTSRSPSYYARQIVKQVKDSVSRKVGNDITNTMKNREHGRDESPQFRVKKLDETSPGKHSNNPSYSPRFRFIDTKQKTPTTTAQSPLNPKDQNTHLPPPAVNTQPQLSRILTKPKPQPLAEKGLQKQKSIPKSKNATNEKFSSRLKRPPLQTSDIIRNKQEEPPFIVFPPSPTKANDIKSTKSKKTHPLSSNVPSLLPVKTEPSPPTTKIPQKQKSQVSDTQETKRSSKLSRFSRQAYKQEGTTTLATRGTNDEDKSNGASTTGADNDNNGPEFQYISDILSRTGVAHKERTTTPKTVSFNQLHPLDPSIFYHLERLQLNPISISPVSNSKDDQDCIFTAKSSMGLSCNRKLLFDLVDEVLLEILRPPLHKCYYNHGDGVSIELERLIEKVWKRIGKFPGAKCEVLEDIDGLIEAEDIQKIKVESEEEGEELVAEIEGNIWDTLVHETVMALCKQKKVGP